MSCGDDVKTLLSRYVDGELSPEERTRADEHVAACVPCRELLQLFQKNESLLSNALSTESFGNNVIEAVISEIKRDGVPAEAKPIEDPVEGFRLKPALQLAAAALFVVGLVVILNGSHSRETSELQAKLNKLAGSQQELTERLTVMLSEITGLLVSMRVEEAARCAREGPGRA